MRLKMIAALPVLISCVILTTLLPTSACATPPPDAPGPRRVAGLVVPAAEVAVRARVDGVIASTTAQPGTRVAAGDVVAALDDATLLLEQQRQKARLSAVSHHIDAARADLLLLQQRGEQLRLTTQRGAVAAFELNQNRAQTEGAAARVKALEEERNEAQIAARVLEARARDYRCVTPIGGEIVQAARLPQEYVRAGEVVAKVRSVRLQLRLNLPQPLAERLSELSFRLPPPDGGRMLTVSEARAERDLAGGRAVLLDAPGNLELTAGQTVEVEVIAP
jgi:multidrug efflux pump subunit AcrA (membrane-fusion protein)